MSPRHVARARCHGLSTRSRGNGYRHAIRYGVQHLVALRVSCLARSPRYRSAPEVAVAGCRVTATGGTRLSRARESQTLNFA